MGIKTTRFDAIEYLESDEAIAAYLDAALEDGDPKLVAAAIGDVARAKGMTEIAEKAGVNRQALYHSLSETGNPTLETLIPVLKAMGVRLGVRQLEHA